MLLLQSWSRGTVSAFGCACDVTRPLLKSIGVVSPDWAAVSVGKVEPLDREKGMIMTQCLQEGRVDALEADTGTMVRSPGAMPRILRIIKENAIAFDRCLLVVVPMACPITHYCPAKSSTNT
jgi:hypothetical protein